MTDDDRQVAPSRGFTTFASGYFVSSLGSKMQDAALLWHLYALTESPVALGALRLVQFAGLMSFALVGGALADAVDRRRLLIGSQVLQMAPAAALGSMTLIGADSARALFFVAAVTSTAQALDTATRRAVAPNLVSPDRLASSLGFLDLSKNLAKLAGPALMGLIVAVSDVGWVYVINAGSFAWMAVAVLLLPPLPRAEFAGLSIRTLWDTIAAGFAFVRKAGVLRALLWLDFTTMFFAGAQALLPVVADQVLGVGAAGYGLLASAGAVGALAAGGVIVTISTGSLGARPGRVSAISSVLYGAAVVGFGLSDSFVGCFVALVAMGASDTVGTVLRNTVFQLQTPDALRGRVNSVSMLCTKAGPHLGDAEASLLAAWVGIAPSIVVGGVLCLLSVGAVVARYPELWRLRGFKGSS